MPKTNKTSQNKPPLQDPKRVALEALIRGENVETIVEATGLSKPTVLGLKGVLVKAEKKRLASLNQPLDNPQSPFLGQPGGENSAHSPGSLTSSSSPGVSSPIAGVIFSPEDLSATRIGLNKQQQRVFDSIVSHASQRMRDQAQQHNGHGRSAYYSSNPYADRLLAIAEARDLKEALGLGGDKLTRSEIKNIIRDEMGRGQREVGAFDQALKLLQFISATQKPGKSIAETVGEISAAVEAFKGISPTPTTWTPEQTILYQKTVSDIKKSEQAAKDDTKFKMEAIKNIGIIAKRVLEDPAAKKLAKAAAKNLTDRVTPNPHEQSQTTEEPAIPPGTFICPKCQAEGKTSLIDVSLSPKVAVCPENPEHKFPRELTEAEKAEEKAQQSAKTKQKPARSEVK